MKFCCDTAITIPSFIFVVYGCDFCFDSFIFVWVVPLLQMIVESCTGQLSDLQQDSQRKFPPQFWITCVFSAGVARFPKPRLASFLGKHSLHEVSALLPVGPPQPLSVVFWVGLYFHILDVQWYTLLVLLSGRFVPSLVPAGGEYQISLPFRDS